MNFLQHKNYQIFHNRHDGWHHLRWAHYPVNYAWEFELTPKKIVCEFFKLQAGALGYYLVDLRKKNFYYCGDDLESVKVSLRKLGGLIKEVYASTERAKIPDIVEEFVNPLEDLGDRYLVYELTPYNRFKPYDVCSPLTNVVDKAFTQDLVISEGELYGRFLAMNGGKPGFYVYKASADEVQYFTEVWTLKQAVISLLDDTPDLVR